MKKKASRPDDVVQKFRRLIHQWENPRRSLATARSRTDSKHFPKIVSTLGQQQTYKRLFAVSTFPVRVEQLIRNPRLPPIDEDGEMVWTACVLRLFEEKINSFCELKSSFFYAYTNGLYEEAESFLDSIEQKLGFSLWLIQYRLQLLQIHKGLKSQKDYVEKILSTEGMNSLIAWLAYFFSLRSEENVSYSKLRDEIEDLIPEPIGDYVLNHILPYNLCEIRNPELTVNWEEPSCVIDRYETFVSMAQLKVCRERDETNANMEIALAQLKNITDPRLRQLENIVKSIPTISLNSKIIAATEKYTLGKYDEIDANETNTLELIARARAILDESCVLNPEDSIKERIINAMHGILIVSPQSQQYRLQLKKIALSCPKHDYSIQIASFLERNHDFGPNARYTQLDYFSAISSDLENPWHSSIIQGFKNKKDWLDKLIQVYPGSLTLALRKALELPSSSNFIPRLESQLPAHRFSMYAGHVAFANNDIPQAIRFYTAPSNHHNTFIASHARRYLYEVLYEAQQYDKCLSLVVEHVLLHPSAVFSYPINDLAKVCLEYGDLHSDINLAILLHLNVVHVHHKWERELSDIFENVLYKACVEKPSELIDTEANFTKEQEIYFLRHICTPRLLDDTTCFENVDEIEEERIKICQHLLSLDPNNKDEYLSEIRGATRDINVAHLLKKVQSSKIFVDEAGLKQSLETTLLDTFLRYQRLLDSPALAYQAEKLSKRLEEMLSAKGNTDIKDLKLPASEREALFDTLLTDFLTEFAFNPAYGLDTHVSTTIRHGAFEGHVRAPFAAEDLLCRKRQKEFLLPRVWESKLDQLTSEELNSITRQLGRFTARIEELISIYLSQKIRVRENHNGGMFIFDTNKAAKDELRESITKATDYNSFLDKFFAHGWTLVDESMRIIRADLRSALLSQINSACDTLIVSLESSFDHDRIVPIVDAVVRAQTSFQSAVADIAEWFRRPQDLARDPFDFEVAVRVALQQIRNCYVKSPLLPKLELHVPEKIEGKLVDGICEIFYILLQNAILHSGFSDQQLPVTVSARRDEGILIISCTNELSPDIDLETRRSLALEAINKYERDTALSLARVEGGSGLSKIWRIAEFDLRLKHTIDIEINEQRLFTTIVTLSGLRVAKNADLHN